MAHAINPSTARIIISKDVNITAERDGHSNLVLFFHSYEALVALKNEVDGLMRNWEEHR